MQSYYVYILQCSDGSYYTGQTDDLERRLNEHLLRVKKDSGAFSYVAKRLPFKLVFAEECGERGEAQEAERIIKGWSRKKKEALIQSGWEAVVGMWREQLKNK